MFSWFQASRIFSWLVPEPTPIVRPAMSLGSLISLMSLPAAVSQPSWSLRYDEKS